MFENPCMCNRYTTPTDAEIERNWHLGRQNPPRWWEPQIFPRAQGPFIRSGATGPQLVVGQWGLIPHFAKSAKLPYQTNNARSEELAIKPTFRQAWARGQRCIIPAESFDEPCWESGHNVWWRFWRRDEAPWGLAGLWNSWLDKETGELIESYTMLTINADNHALMRRMHKPDPKLAADAQDKRSVVPIEVGDVDLWLGGKNEEVGLLLRCAPEEVFRAAPIEEQPRQSSLL